MAFPSSPTNGQTTFVNGITYIYNATNNAWRRQNLTDITVSGTVAASNVEVSSGVTFNDSSRITSGLVYDLDTIYPDGTKNTFYMRYNQSPVANISNPWNLFVTINGYIQPAFTENTDTVWLSHALCAYTGYTISSGNIKFSDTLPAGTTVQIKTALGSANTNPKIYPFKPLDILLGL
jgi:hypothetical protein